MNIDKVLEFIARTEKPFNDMLDSHIAFFQEQDVEKQKLYRALYEYKQSGYELKKKGLYGQ